MKKIIFFAMAAIVLGMSSCSGDGQLSESSAKKALKQEPMFAKDYDVVAFTTGYQSVDQNDLDVLAKLEAAGMVTFSVDTVIEYSSMTRWNPYIYDFVEIPIEKSHYFAQVDLTKEGLKLEVEEHTTMRKDLAEELAGNQDLEEDEPDYMNAVYNRGGENAAVVVEETVESVSDSVYVDSAAVEVAEAVTPANSSNKNAAYEAACARCFTTQHYMLKGRWDLIKVKEVKCTQKMYEEGVGSCRFFAKYVDKTPFGYVIGAPTLNKIETGEATFTLYQDMGWIVKNISD